MCTCGLDTQASHANDSCSFKAVVSVKVSYPSRCTHIKPKLRAVGLSPNWVSLKTMLQSDLGPCFPFVGTASRAPGSCDNMLSQQLEDKASLQTGPLPPSRHSKLTPPTRAVVNC